MKAAVIYDNGGPEVLRYEEIDESQCRAGHVVVDAEAVSIEGGDLLARAGVLPTKTPHVVGYLPLLRRRDGFQQPDIRPRS